MLKQVKDPRHQSYITYKSHVMLMTRILSSIFYISSIRKTSEEFNSERVIGNIRYLCNEKELSELPYWETINHFLKRLEPEELQSIICQLVRHLIRSHAFDDGRIRGRYWQIIVDGTQLESSRKELDKKSLYRVHHRGEDAEYKEYYYYVLEAKLYLHTDIQVSIMTEFVENNGKEADKQDCERKACMRLMEKLKKEFPMLPTCLCGDSLYACEAFFQNCRVRNWKFLLRFKQGSIPSVYGEYESLKKRERNLQEERQGERLWRYYDYVEGIDYNGCAVNMVEYGDVSKGKHFHFITDLSVGKKNVKTLAEQGRRRWTIENEGFNTQKNGGYYLEHMFSRNYQGMKNHYYLIQIGHMISQIIEAWEKLWKKVKQSRKQKHKRLLDAWKQEDLAEYEAEVGRGFQIRFA